METFRVQGLVSGINSQDIIEVSNDPNLCLTSLEIGRGLGQTIGFYPVRMEWPMSEEQYEEYKATPWPESTHETLVIRPGIPFQLEETLPPGSGQEYSVLTVNGQAEIVVQDAKSYQRLLARAEEADRLMELRRGIAEYRAGRTRDVEDALGEMESRHLGKAKRSGTRRDACAARSSSPRSARPISTIFFATLPSTVR